jgi:hypothetical protein
MRRIHILGSQENANLEDIVKFFEGYELMGNPVTLMKKVCLQILAGTCWKGTSPGARAHALERSHANMSKLTRYQLVPHTWHAIFLFLKVHVSYNQIRRNCRRPQG